MQRSWLLRANCVCVCVDCIPLSAPRMRMSIIVTIYLDSMRFRVDTMLTLIHFSFLSAVHIQTEWTLLSLYIRSPLLAHSVANPFAIAWQRPIAIGPLYEHSVQHCWSYCYGYCSYGVYFAYAFFIHSFIRYAMYMTLEMEHSHRWPAIQSVRAYSMWCAFAFYCHCSLSLLCHSNTDKLLHHNINAL